MPAGSASSSRLSALSASGFCSPLSRTPKRPFAVSCDTTSPSRSLSSGRAARPWSRTCSVWAISLNEGGSWAQAPPPGCGHARCMNGSFNIRTRQGGCGQ
eukprot:5344406-Prymnesium_polylepis.2